MTEVIGVRFRGGCKEYYFDPHGIAVEAGQFVIVETAQGTEYAQCLTGNHEVDDGAVVRPLRALVRIATENDRRTMEYNRQREKDAFGICQRKIAERGLDMKLVRVECSFDGSKIVFFFTSEGRVDFRELVRDLAGVFRARIELRQIGEDARRPRHLRPSVLLRAVSGRFCARVHQDGQDTESQPESYENFRRVRPPHVLPEVRAGGLRGRREADAEE